MNRINRLMGILGIPAAALPAGAFAAAVFFSSRGFSPLNAFYNELGLFSGGYFVPSFALLVNLALVLLGLVFGALMVTDALTKDTVQSTAIGFFGALTGVLAMAAGIFTINITEYHYIASSAFHISAAVLCALYVIFQLINRGKMRIATMITAALCCAAGSVYAWYMLSGGMSAYLVASTTENRAGIELFALVGWAALALFLAFTVLYAVGLLGAKRKKAEAPNLLDLDAEDDDESPALETIADEPIEESLGEDLQIDLDESAQDDNLYGL